MAMDATIALTSVTPVIDEMEAPVLFDRRLKGPLGLADGLWSQLGIVQYRTSTTVCMGKA